MSSEDLLSFRRAPTEVVRASLRGFAQVLRDQVAQGRDFHCLITNDREVQQLNLRFLGKNHSTDVLSFPSAAQALAPGNTLGDMAVSAERAAEQARRYGHSLDEELRILMLHGVLHLLGMDHEADRGRMRRAEAAWRKKFGLPAGLIERVHS
jgi:probable rRNA maturation factor